jgi:hypothetical protein
MFDMLLKWESIVKISLNVGKICENYTQYTDVGLTLPNPTQTDPCKPEYHIFGNFETLIDVGLT